MDQFQACVSLTRTQQDKTSKAKNVLPVKYIHLAVNFFYVKRKLGSLVSTLRTQQLNIY